jgi:hypothetical protein
VAASVLGQGRFWRASMGRGGEHVVLALLRDALPEDLRELRDFKISVPLEKWNRVVKQVQADRKLLGGVLLDFAQNKDQLSAAVASDRLFGELQRVIVDATAALVERGALALTVVDVGAS